MDFFKVLARRRSVRRFAARRIPAAVLRKLIAAVRLAPSSMDGQPWEIIAIRDARTKGLLARFKNSWCPKAKREFDASFLTEASVILVVCVDKEKSYARWLENGVIASTYLMLAACALGLGSTFMTAFNLSRPAQMRQLRRLLGIPGGVNPVCILPLGYPAGRPARKALRAAAGFTHHERF
jgi:nitroreductase